MVIGLTRGRTGARITRADFRAPGVDTAGSHAIFEAFRSPRSLAPADSSPATTMTLDLAFAPTAIRHPTNRPANRGVERAFYGGMSVLLCVCVYIGFSATYFQAGML